MANPTGLIDELITKTPDWRGATFAKLRKVVHDADPKIIEEVKWRRPSNPLGTPTWEHNGIVCVGNILKERVRLTFFAGASLPDPHKLFNTRFGSKTVRGIDFYEGDKPNATALKALIRAAVKHNLAKASPAKARKK